MSRDSVETRVLGVLRWVVIAGLLVLTVFPFLYMVLLSVKDLGAVIQDPGNLLPDGDSLDLSTYSEVLKSTADGGQGFLGFMRNSAVIAVVTVVVTLLFAIPGSYAVSRLRFPGSRQVSVLFLAVYLFPSILLAVPLFVFFTKIGLRGSLAA